MMDQDARDVYTERYERLQEMFVGNPDVTDSELRREAAVYAKRLTGGKSEQPEQPAQEQ